MEGEGRVFWKEGGGKNETYCRREKGEDVHVHVRGRRRVRKWCVGKLVVGGRGGLGEEGGEGGGEGGAGE